MAQKIDFFGTVRTPDPTSKPPAFSGRPIGHVQATSIDLGFIQIYRDLVQIMKYSGMASVAMSAQAIGTQAICSRVLVRAVWIVRCDSSWLEPW